MAKPSRRQKISAASLLAAIFHDPLWADKLSCEVEVVDYANLCGSKIKRLSPKLHFTGCNESGWSANFEKCRFLENAEGHFSHAVSFHNSGIKTIGDLTIDCPSQEGFSADFSGCINLNIARGTYPSFVDFSGSGVSKIENLTIAPTTNKSNGQAREIYHKVLNKEVKGKLASFLNCKNLKKWPTQKIDNKNHVQNQKQKTTLNTKDFLLDIELVKTLLLDDLNRRSEITL